MTLDLDNLSVADQKRWDTYSMISDVSKSVNGCRYRFDWSQYTQEELDAILDSYIKQSEIVAKEEAEWEAQKQVELEKNIQSVIDAGAGDRQTAIRWMWDAFLEEEQYPDPDYWMYGLQIGYNSPLAKELKSAIAA